MPKSHTRYENKLDSVSENAQLFRRKILLYFS